MGFLGSSVVKNPPANAGDAGDESWIPGSGRWPGGRNGNPIQYSCLENSMDRGAWWATIHGVAKSQTQLVFICMCWFNFRNPNKHKILIFFFTLSILELLINLHIQN